MEAAPDLKKSVESSMRLTLVRMLCHTACEDTVQSQRGTRCSERTEAVVRTLISSAKEFSSSVSSTAALLPELKYCAAAIIFPSSN